jgi:hypothetical protein
LVVELPERVEPEAEQEGERDGSSWEQSIPEAEAASRLRWTANTQEAQGIQQMRKMIELNSRWQKHAQNFVMESECWRPVRLGMKTWRPRSSWRTSSTNWWHGISGKLNLSTVAAVAISACGSRGESKGKVVNAKWWSNQCKR